MGAYPSYYCALYPITGADVPALIGLYINVDQLAHDPQIEGPRDKLLSTVKALAAHAKSQKRQVHVLLLDGIDVVGPMIGFGYLDFVGALCTPFPALAYRKTTDTKTYTVVFAAACQTAFERGVGVVFSENASTENGEALAYYGSDKEFARAEARDLRPSLFPPPRK